MDVYDHRGKRLDEPDYDPEYDDPNEPDQIAYCPNCDAQYAIVDGVTYYCKVCGALWERTDHILTPEEERAAMETL